MNRKIVLSLAFVLVVSMFTGVTSCMAAADVGASVGQSYDSTYGLSGTERDENGTLLEFFPFEVNYLETVTVQQVSGTNVTIEYSRDLLNGTTTSGTSWVDLNTGEGTAFLVVIPSGLSEDSLLYPDWVNENGTSEGGPIVTDTVYLTEGDTSVEATHFGYNYTVEGEQWQRDYYWEKSTGILIKYTTSGSATTAEGTTQFLSEHFSRVGLDRVFSPLVDTEDYPVSVSTNSEVLGFEFKLEEKQLRLRVSGKTGTVGSCQVAVPNELLSGSFTLTMDDFDLVEGTDYTQSNNGTHQIFDIEYVHSTHTIEITGTQTIPEFSSLLLVSLFLISSLVAVAVYRKRLVRSTA